MTKKKISTILLTIVLAISAIALSACDQVPEEYKIEKFYGEFSKGMDECYHVTIGYFDEEMQAMAGEAWDVFSISKGTAVCRDNFTGERIEKTYKEAVLEEANRLMSQLGTSVTVSKKTIRLNDSNTVLHFTRTWYDENQQRVLVFNSNQDIAQGVYKAASEGVSEQVFSVALVSEVVVDNVSYKVVVNKDYRRI